MATIHPSRAALVPKDSIAYAERRQHRSPSPHRSRSAERSKNNRASPEYDDYKRPSQEVQAPWRQNNPGVRERPPYHGPDAYGAVGGDMMDSRRAKRAATVVDIWPPSPKAPVRDLSPKRGKSSKKSKRPRSVSSDSSEEEHRRRKERKAKRKARKENGRKSRKRSDSESDSDDRLRRDRRSNRSQTRDLLAGRTPDPPPDDEDDWVVKSAPPSSIVAIAPVNDGGPSKFTAMAAADNGGDSDEEVGPQPLHKPSTTKRLDERSYGGALLRGEGSAMAAFLQDGTESRIPRRGEIGLTSDEIAKYEDVGYVMSGSRHRRMNAVRMRKENQVISAEEKRGILKLQKEERERREAILREEFSELVNDRLKGTETRNTN